MSTDQEKTITLITDSLEIPGARRWVGAWAIACGLRVIRFDERRGRLSTELKVTVAGHPRPIREFHDDVRGDALSATTSGDLIDPFITPIVVSGFRKARRTWQGRNDPPLNAETDADGPRTVVYWRWADVGLDGTGVGPVTIDRYAAGAVQPYESEDWGKWVERGDALAYAREHGFTFFADE